MKTRVMRAMALRHAVMLVVCAGMLVPFYWVVKTVLRRGGRLPVPWCACSAETSSANRSVGIF